SVHGSDSRLRGQFHDADFAIVDAELKWHSLHWVLVLHLQHPKRLRVAFFVVKETDPVQIPNPPEEGLDAVVDEDSGEDNPVPEVPSGIGAVEESPEGSFLAIRVSYRGVHA